MLVGRVLYKTRSTFLQPWPWLGLMFTVMFTRKEATSHTSTSRARPGFHMGCTKSPVFKRTTEPIVVQGDPGPKRPKGGTDMRHRARKMKAGVRRHFVRGYLQISQVLSKKAFETFRNPRKYSTSYNTHIYLPGPPHRGPSTVARHGATPS